MACGKGRRANASASSEDGVSKSNGSPFAYWRLYSIGDGSSCQMRQAVCHRYYLSVIGSPGLGGAKGAGEEVR